MIEISVTSPENSHRSEKDPTNDVLSRTQARPPSSPVLHFDNSLISIQPLRLLFVTESSSIKTVSLIAFVGTPDIVFLVFLRKRLVLNGPELVVLRANA